MLKPISSTIIEGVFVVSHKTSSIAHVNQAMPIYLWLVTIIPSLLIPNPVTVIEKEKTNAETILSVHSTETEKMYTIESIDYMNFIHFIPMVYL